MVRQNVHGDARYGMQIKDSSTKKMSPPILYQITKSMLILVQMRKYIHVKKGQQMNSESITISTLLWSSVSFKVDERWEVALVEAPCVSVLPGLNLSLLHDVFFSPCPVSAGK